MPQTIKAICSKCGKVHEVEARKRINVADDPSLKDKVRDGSLFVWECPDCGTANLAVYDTLYHDPEEKVMIWLLPPGSVDESSVEALEQQLRDHSDDLDGYILRRVEDVGSLIEKVNIFDAGLDDCVIELCKYVTKMELKNQGGGDGVLDLRMKFYKADDAQGEMVFTYPEKGGIMGVRTGFNVYEDCAGILRRNPSVKVTSGFAIIDHEWVSGIFG